MIFKGVKIKVSCATWEQIEVLGDFWSLMSSNVEMEKLVGLGFNWHNDSFEYAIGLIDRYDELDRIIHSNAGEYIEIELPDRGWRTQKGKTEAIQKIYEDEFDCYNTRFKYELEKFDKHGNCEISVNVEK